MGRVGSGFIRGSTLITLALDGGQGLRVRWHAAAEEGILNQDTDILKFGLPDLRKAALVFYKTRIQIFQGMVG